MSEATVARPGPKATSVMKFCPRDESLLFKYIEGTEVRFRCTLCPHQQAGDSEDYILTMNEGHKLVERYRALLTNAPEDPTAQRIPHDCECGLDYATLVILGEEMVPYIVCKCGRMTTN